jgi:hypothetical protein
MNDNDELTFDDVICALLGVIVLMMMIVCACVWA